MAFCWHSFATQLDFLNALRGPATKNQKYFSKENVSPVIMEAESTVIRGKSVDCAHEKENDLVLCTNVPKLDLPFFR